MTRGDRRIGRSLVFVGIIAFVIRLAFGLVYWVGKPLMLDEQEYLLLATALATGQGFTYPPPPPGTSTRHFERPPGFAFFLAGLLKVTDDPLVASADPRAAFPRSSSDVPLAIKIAQSTLGAMAACLLAALVARAAGRMAGLIAGVVVATYPPLVWTCAYVLAEPLYSFLAFGTVWLLLRATDAAGGRQFRLACIAGIAAGVGLLTKEAMLFFLLLASPWLLLMRRETAAAGLVLGATLAVAPWVARNHALYGRFVLTAAHGGVTLWTGNNPLARGEGDLAANPDMGRARVAFEDSHPGLNNQQLDALYYRQVIQFITRQPVRWLWLEMRKLFFLIVPIGPSYRLHSTRYYAASLVSYALLMPFAVTGGWSLARSGAGRGLWPVWIMGASVIVMSLVFFPQERFRIPVLDPVAIVAAVAGRNRLFLG